MAGNKMAVRKSRKTNQRSWDFSLPSMNNERLKWLILITFSCGLIYLISVGSETWQRLWPVEKLVLQGDTKFVKHQDLIEFMQQHSTKGMLALDLQQLQKEAKANHWIKELEIRKVWPGQLSFLVQEHIPVAIFDNVALTLQGTEVEIIDEHDALSQLPIINHVNYSSVSIDKKMFIWNDFKKMKRQFELLDLVLENLTIDEINNWHLKFSQGLELNLGRINRLERIERLVNIFSEIENNQQIKKIDLRYHNGLAVEWLKTTELKLKG